MFFTIRIYKSSKSAEIIKVQKVPTKNYVVL